MKEITCQVKKGLLLPYTDDDHLALSEYKINQIVKVKVTGYRKQRSATQLGLLMACIKLVADNSDNENWNTPGRAKLSLKAMLGYVDESCSVVVDNRVIVKYRSFAFSELSHMESVGLFDKAFPVLASVIGLQEGELIAEAKSRMLTRG